MKQLLSNSRRRAAARSAKRVERRSPRSEGVAQETSVGRVVCLFLSEGFGILAMPDGREIRFHRNSVVDDFYQLFPGSKVSFVEAAGQDGPRARSISRMGRRRQLTRQRRPARTPGRRSGSKSTATVTA